MQTVPPTNVILVIIVATILKIIIHVVAEILSIGTKT